MSLPVTDAIRQWRSRTLLPTSLSSYEMREAGRQVALRSVWSARTTNAEYLQTIKRVVDDMLEGRINQATGRLHLIRKLAELGYDPETGFPDDLGAVPPAERGSLQDLSSAARINLVLEINERMAANYGMMVAGNTEYARQEYPAWELIRVLDRRVERGTPESRSVGWDLRWEEAGAAVAWEGAISFPWIALKDSPIWQALGDGEGGYIDTLGNPFPPFAFGSGMGWRAVPRREAVRLRLVDDKRVPAQTRGQLSPGAKEVSDAYKKLDPELQEELRKELGL